MHYKQAVGLPPQRRRNMCVRVCEFKCTMGKQCVSFVATPPPSEPSRWRVVAADPSMNLGSSFSSISSAASNSALQEGH